MTQYTNSITGKTEDVVATLDDLRELIARGDFHHATYRDIGMCHEGLKIYAKDDTPRGFRGFRHVGGFAGGHYATEEQKAICREAERIVAKFGTHVGSYGNG